ncbi:tonB family C-terminal domain protein [Bordetella holmesii 30539]|uniref:Protein TonB n=1 Tax=Bordetella holmesii 1058 TaxID=1247648 RepID=A0ABN0RVQ3_9BORD|nr:tonB family C-terminal domain protein [Bordetella holmesii ATCC 51541]AIT27314.1 tonB family C-terminal domain protein [Bordetella holmesii 44057]EWM43400.1 tonB family C-terminal domain protein [Bordetella holmesii 41130]EWM47901.1 tonB family C-terminal domain protein [Bordetella holmesii 35009]EWM52061.1 tonB family C-terminal domain protein [Bordetella holmesii 70147]EXF87351.1 tonB family C-terminal domain protein [Bordetella holmesii 30539]EXX93356.1 tonB family C-terminal domain pro
MGLRVGAGIAVLAVHAAVIGAIFFNDTEAPVLLDQEPVMVSVIEAPVPQVAKAEPNPEPPVQETPPPESVVDPTPEPDPEPEIEPEPEPEPVVEKPPVPAPPPPPKPKPKPKPQPKPQPKTEVKADPTPKPPAGETDGEQVTQAPKQGPAPDQPVFMSSVEYLGDRPAPRYPSESIRRREQGRVIVLVTINPQGYVDKAVVDSSSGFRRLDDSAIEAVRKARFKPLTRNGIAQTAMARIPFDFGLK